MSASELETVVRLGLPMLVVVYNDAAYGAEVHHFGPRRRTTCAPSCSRTPTSPPSAAAIGFEAVTVRTVADLDAGRAWLDAGRPRPLLVDAKVVDQQPSWWLEEAFRGH